MKVYTDSEGRILAVGTTDDVSLIEHTIADDEQNPFIGWSDAKIMCYRVTVDNDGHVTMMTPYVPSNLIDKISQMQTDIRNNGTTTASEWKANKIINADEYISYNGALYYCLVTNKGIVPTDTRYYRSTDVVTELNNILRRIEA